MDDETKKLPADEEPEDLNGIAVIGMSGRFPGANDLETFWKNICTGKESIKFFTDEEMIAAGVPSTLVKNPAFVKANGVLDHIEMFDADFFSFTAREAQITDPQQRLFIECAWEALENAGYNVETYPGSIGVYGGASSDNTYYWRYIFNNHALRESVGDFQLNIDNDRDFLTTRISYKFNLRGPSLNIQTACSSSLVAIVIACQSLYTYQCDMALAGGVCIRLPQEYGYLYKEGMILSPDGHCRAFDSGANGTVCGNGVGMILLKRLEDAIRDKDHIYAVIKGFALNNDGAMKVGYAAPSAEGQAEVIATALAMADVEPETISYIEAHGTGTPLGDPIEMAALKKAFSTAGEDHQNTGSRAYARDAARNYCAIGSVKPNIGHLDIAAGVAGIIKAVLALEHKELPPTINFKTPNPKIDFENSPFYVNVKHRSWEEGKTPRRAAVSSFGVGGTNAHIVLQEAPASTISRSEILPQLLIWSSKNTGTLARQRENLLEYLKTHPNEILQDVAFTLQVGRKEFQHRQFLIAESLPDAINKLKNNYQEFINVTTEPTIFFIFNDLSDHDTELGLEFYQTEPTFKKILEDTIPSEGFLSKKLTAKQMSFLTQYVIARSLLAWGISIKNAIGYGVGKHTADCMMDRKTFAEAYAEINQEGILDTKEKFQHELQELQNWPEENKIFIEFFPESSVHAQNFILETLSKLWVSGARIDWNTYNAEKDVYRVSLPTYPFERKRFWLDEAATQPLTTSILENDIEQAKTAVKETSDLMSEDQIESTLQKMWMDIFGIPKVSVKENFFDIGGDSLIAVQVMQAIHKHFNINLQVSKLFEFPTIEAVAKLIREKSESTTSAIVTIRAHGELLPIFCMHPIGGNVLCYSQLSRELSTNKPFYGIQQTEETKDFNTIEQLAAFYLSQIQRKQPKGPYYLCGWSFGGLLAFEMTYLLEKQKEKVAYLGLIDCTAAHEMERMGDLSHAELLILFIKMFWGFNDENITINHKLSEEEQLQQALDIGVKANLLQIDAELDEVKKLFLRFKNNLHASEVYQQKVIHTDLDLYMANEALDFGGFNKVDVNNFAKDWGKYTQGAIYTSIISGNHFTVLQNPGVKRLGEEINKAFKVTEKAY